MMPSILKSVSCLLARAIQRGRSCQSGCSPSFVEKARSASGPLHRVFSESHDQQEQLRRVLNDANRDASETFRILCNEIAFVARTNGKANGCKGGAQ